MKPNEKSFSTFYYLIFIFKTNKYFIRKEESLNKKKWNKKEVSFSNNFLITMEKNPLIKKKTKKLRNNTEGQVT